MHNNTKRADFHKFWPAFLEYFGQCVLYVISDRKETVCKHTLLQPSLHKN